MIAETSFLMEDPRALRTRIFHDHENCHPGFLLLSTGMALVCPEIFT